MRILAPIDEYCLDPRLETLKGCTRCKLAPTFNAEAKQVCMPVGSLEAKAALVFESPGTNENETGFTVVGASYQLIEWLKQLGMDEIKDFIRFNAAMCKAPGETKPTKSHLNQCRHNMDYILRNMPNCKMIVPIGDIALKQVEGADAILSLRVGRPGRIEYLEREFYTLPLRHPAWLMRIENGRGQIKALQEYRSHLKTFKDFFDNLDHIEDFKLPYELHICYTREEGQYWANKIATDPNITHIVIDFETGQIQAGCWGESICLAIAFELDGVIHTVLFIFKQCVDDIAKAVKAKRGKKIFWHDWRLAPWFEEAPEYETKVMEQLQWVISGTGVPTKSERPFVSAWNAKFDSSTMFNNYGFRLVPRPEQVPDLSRQIDIEIPPRDIMLMYRFLDSDLRSLSLKTVLSATMPFYAMEKDPVTQALEHLYGKPTIEETGYMLMAVKPPKGVSVEEIKYWAEHPETSNDFEKEIVEKNWCPNIKAVRSQVLFEYGATDSALELDLFKRAKEMALSQDFISIGMPLGDEIFV